MQSKNTHVRPVLVLFIHILVILVLACEREEPSEEQRAKAAPSRSSEVGLSEAKDVARFYASSDSVAVKSARTNWEGDEIVDYRIISDDREKPLFYIFKKSRGFTIVSADLHVMPVLAFSENSGITLDSIPNGVKLWIDMAREKVMHARSDTSSPHPIVLKEWQKYLSRDLRVNDSWCVEWYQYGQYQCKYSSTQKGPLVTTHWGQRKLATTQLSSAGDCDNCGRRVAGCGPVAMAQLEEFYHSNLSRPRFPKDTCTASNAGEISLGALMKAMGTKAKASYNFNGTCNTFTWPSNVKSGLKDFGFSNGGNANEAYNYSLIKSELNGNHPLIFWGSTCLDCFSNYHIWLCDGYLEHNYSDFNCTTKQCNAWTYSYLHMNWGWSGSWNDWYAFGQYNPDGHDYNANLHVISGIRP